MVMMVVVRWCSSPDDWGTFRRNLLTNENQGVAQYHIAILFGLFGADLKKEVTNNNQVLKLVQALVTGLTGKDYFHLSLTFNLPSQMISLQMVDKSGPSQLLIDFWSNFNLSNVCCRFWRPETRAEVRWKISPGFRLANGPADWTRLLSFCSSGANITTTWANVSQSSCVGESFLNNWKEEEEDEWICRIFTNLSLARFWWSYSFKKEVCHFPELFTFLGLFPHNRKLIECTF